MALPRSLAFMRIGSGLSTLEVFLDPLCPFCAKIEKGISANVLPLIGKGGKYDGKLSLVARPYPQPFHYFSTFHAEAMIAFGQTYPDLYWKYTTAIYETQRDFMNVPSQSMTPSQARDKLAELALSVLEANGRLPDGPRSKVFGEFRDGLEVKKGKDGGVNGGNEATAGLKYNIKIGRQNGVHVTPTVMFDGLKEDSVSSSWGKEEWEKFLSSKLDS